MLRKSQPDFQHYVKKIEAQVQKCSSHKKTCITDFPYIFWLKVPYLDNKVV